MQLTRQDPSLEVQNGSAPYPASMRDALGSYQDEASNQVPYSALASLCPLGAFDSGMGGLSVLREVRQVLPGEDIIYYGDHANIPYGGRSDEWLRNRSLEIADFLLERGAKAILVACNTASAAGLEHLRARHSVPIIGLVPAVKPAVALTRTGKVGVLATKGALRGRLLSDVIDRFAAPAGVEVITVAPDSLVEAVERGDLNTPETAGAVRRAVAPMLDAGVDAVVLGCTHFPFLRPLLRDALGENIQVVDSGGGVARQTARVLASRHLLKTDGRPGALTVYTSADPAVVAPVVHALVGSDVPVFQA